MSNLEFLNESNITYDTQLQIAKIFNKVDIYGRNRNLAMINESYRRYNRSIPFTRQEQGTIKKIFQLIEEAAAESIINEYNLVEAYYTGELNEDVKNLLKKGKEKLTKTVSKIKTSTEEGIEKLKALREFFEVIKNKAVNTVDKFIRLLLDIFNKLASTVQEGIKKLLGDSLNVEDNDSKLPDNDITSEFEQEDKGFLGLVYEYLQHKISDSSSFERVKNAFASTEKKTVKESKLFPRQDYQPVFEYYENKKQRHALLEDSLKDKFDDFVYKNKVFQWFVGYRPGKGKVKWWKSLLASIVGSIIFTLIIPAILTVSFGATPTVGIICFAIQITWGCRGVCKVLLARYTSKKPDEKFWNTPTAIAFIIAVAFVIIPRIPAVREWMTNCIHDFFEWSGLDKKINDLEDWIRNLFGAVKTEKDVVVRYEKISDHLERFQPRSGHGTILSQSYGGGLGISSTAEDSINLIKNNTNIDGPMRKALTNLQDLVNNQHFVGHGGSMAMDNFMVGKVHGTDKAVYMFDMSRAIGKGGKFQGKSVAWVSNWLKERLEEKGINGKAFNILNDELRDATNSIAGANIVYATDIPVTQGADFEGIFSDIAREAGIAGDSTGTIGVLLNDLNDTMSVEEVITTPVHTFTDFIANNFTPIFWPWMGNSGEWAARYYGDPNVYPIVARKEMTYEELDNITDRNIGNSWKLFARKERAKRRKEVMALINAQKENRKNYSKEEWEQVKKGLKEEIRIYNNFKPADNKILVFFTTGKFKVKSKDSDEYKTIELKNQPLFAWNPYILYQADLQDITAINTGNEKVNWYMRGLFKNHMYIAPVNENDKSVQKDIKKTCNTVFDSMIKTAANGYGVDKLAVYENNKWSPVPNENPDKNIKLMGNFKRSELCKVWNEEEEAYTYLWVDDEFTDRGYKPAPIPEDKDSKAMIVRPSSDLVTERDPKENKAMAMVIRKSDLPENIKKEAIYIKWFKYLLQWYVDEFFGGKIKNRDEFNNCIEFVNNSAEFIINYFKEHPEEKEDDKVWSKLIDEIKRQIKNSNKGNSRIIDTEAEDVTNSEIKQLPARKQVIQDIIHDTGTNKKAKSVRFNFPDASDRKRFYNDLMKNGKLSKEDYKALEDKFYSGKYYKSSEDGKHPTKLSDEMTDKIVNYIINTIAKYSQDGTMTADNFRKCRKNLADWLYKHHIILESEGFRYNKLLHG